MPETTDWRSARIAEAMKRLERPGFAVEFLRRSPVYCTDYARTLRCVAAGAVSEDRAFADFARRWGLRFPFRSGGRV